MSDRRRWLVTLGAAAALTVLTAVCITATRAEPSRQLPEQKLVFADEFEQTNFPAALEVDYVRIWQGDA